MLSDARKNFLTNRSEKNHPAVANKLFEFLNNGTCPRITPPESFGPYTSIHQDFHVRFLCLL
jgi:hypothetical protein